jgi:phosphopantetheinyl transferase
MGIIRKIEENNYSIIVWDMCESLDELMVLGKEFNTKNYKTEKRKKEFLTSRIILKEIYPKERISYNEFGAPELSNGIFISISHSKNLVSVITSKTKVGIDIEEISNKALRLSDKFINSNKHKNLTPEKANLIWCCKEAVFKWHQKGKVDFKNDIQLIPFKLKETGKINCTFKNQTLILNYHKINNHYLVYVCK